MNRKTKWILEASVFAILIAVATGFAVGLTENARLDLTEDQLYSVGDYTKEVVQGLDDEIRVTYWVSERVQPDFHNTRQDIVDFLTELERLSPFLTVEIRDPAEWIEARAEEERQKEAEEGPEEEEVSSAFPFGGGDLRKQLPPRDRAKLDFTEEFGIREVEGRTFDEDRAESVLFFSGIRITFGEDEPRTIPLVQSRRGIEYELLSRILKLTQPKPIIAFFDGQPEDKIPGGQPQFPGQPPQDISPYGPLIDFLRNDFDVRRCELSEFSPVPPGAQLLIVARPKDLIERQLYEIDRFVHEGGSLLLLASYHQGDVFRLEQQRAPAYTTVEPGIEPLLTHWGIGLGRELVLSQSCPSMPIMGRDGSLTLISVQPLPATSASQLAADSPLTKGVRELVLPFSSPLTAARGRIEEMGLELTTVVRSMENSWLGNWETAFQRYDDPAQYRAVDLAYELTGVFPSLWTEGNSLPQWVTEGDGEEDSASEATPDDSGEADDAPSADQPRVPARKARSGRVVICSSSDIGRIETLQRYQADVGFIANCVESLGLDRNLLDIRTKSFVDRRIGGGEDAEEQDSIDRKKTIVQYGNAIAIPLLVLVLGFVRWLSRSVAAANYERQYLSSGSGGGAA